MLVYSLKESWQMGWDYNIGRLPMVDQWGKLVAMMTRTDLVQAFELLYQDLDAIINSSYDSIVVLDRNCEPFKHNQASNKLVMNLNDQAYQGHFSIEVPIFKGGLKEAMAEISRRALEKRGSVSFIKRIGPGYG